MTRPSCWAFIAALSSFSDRLPTGVAVDLHTRGRGYLEQLGHIVLDCGSVKVRGNRAGLGVALDQAAAGAVRTQQKVVAQSSVLGSLSLTATICRASDSTSANFPSWMLISTSNRTRPVDMFLSGINQWRGAARPIGRGHEKVNLRDRDADRVRQTPIACRRRTLRGISCRREDCLGLQHAALPSLATLSCRCRHFSVFHVGDVVDAVAFCRYGTRIYARHDGNRIRLLPRLRTPP